MKGAKKVKRYEVQRGCVLCETCVSVCPAGAIKLDKKSAVIEQDKCKRCGACYENCPSDAIIVIEE